MPFLSPNQQHQSTEGSTGPLQMEKGDKGSTLTRMGVSGWMFLLVPAYMGCPGQTAVKWLLLLLLQPFDRFWWNLARWCILAPYSGKTIKISNFLKFKMAAAAILKITKIAISPQRFDRSLWNLVCWCKIGLLTAQNFKNPRWWTAAILRTVTSSYLSNLLTDFY